jgi:pilus assembly protein CpaC
MTAPGSIRAILLTIVLAMLAGLATTAQAQSPSYMRLAEGDLLENRPVYLGINKSVVVDLPRAAGDVLVSNPQVADAVLRTSTRLYLIGVQLGQASVFLFDNGGQQIASFDIYVEADLTGLNRLLAEAVPSGYVRADAINNSIVLRGQVPSSAEAARAEELARRMLPVFVTASTTASGTSTAAGGTSSSERQEFSEDSGPQVVNLIQITGEEQVALKVIIAEVQRSVVKQLGVNTEALLNELVDIDFSNPLRFPFTSATDGATLGLSWADADDSVSATIQALEETRMLRTLAEPTLTAVSGETANFLAGGEFPVPVAGDEGEITVAFKEFGVNLAFTPVVLGPGRISLKVRTEVSDISANGAVSLPIGGGFTVTIPATVVRRAETTVELPSGGAFVIAGLVQQDTRRAASGLPWLQSLPVLGMLFSSKDFQDNQTELVMIVTPYLVTPASPQDLTSPNENLMMANDAEAYFLNRLTKVYGAADATGGTGGAVGFTFD